MPSPASISYLDYNGERSTFQINVPLVDAANIDGTLAAVNELRTTSLAISIGTSPQLLLNATQRFGTALPTDPNAQREKKWLITAEDVQEFLDPGDDTVPNPAYRKLYTYELPCANATLLTGNVDILFPYAGGTPIPAVAAFIEDFETIAKSPAGGTLNIRQIRLVGRNL